MAPIGNIISYSYTSAARIPLSDVVVTITELNATGDADLISVQMSDRSGKTGAITLSTPPVEDSLSPGQERPFTTVTMTAEVPGYEKIRVENVQVFPDTLTIQNFQLIPLNSTPSDVLPTETFTVEPQNL